jgi:hypothetical protein
MLLNRQGQVVSLPEKAAQEQLREVREVLEPSSHFPRTWASIETRAKFKQEKK